MIQIVVATPKGEVTNMNCTFLSVDGDFGQVGILENRLPIIMKITSSYIRVESVTTFYIAIVNGILDFQDNVATVVAQDASISDSLENALKAIEANKERILKENKRKTVDFVQAEKELVKNIKEIKASKE